MEGEIDLCMEMRQYRHRCWETARDKQRQRASSLTTVIFLKTSVIQVEYRAGARSDCIYVAVNYGSLPAWIFFFN